MSVTVIVRYTVGSPAAAEENAALVRAVFAELATTDGLPAGFRYRALRDGTAFTHIATEPTPGAVLRGLESFRAFQAGLRDRCAGGSPPELVEVEEVGAFHG